MRMKNILLTELLNERLRAYEELERTLNKRDDIDNVIKQSKYYLAEIVKLNAMVSELESVISNSASDDINNTIKKDN